MVKYIKSLVHKGLIVRSTDKAVLIVIPRDLSDGAWFTWLPKSMLKVSSQDYYYYKYQKDKVFKMIQSHEIDIPMNQWNNVKRLKAKQFQNIFEEYDTTDLDEISLINNIEYNIDVLEKVTSAVRFSLETIQEIERLPKEIDDLISETDLSELDVLVENINLAKERYKNE